MGGGGEWDYRGDRAGDSAVVRDLRVENLPPIANALVLSL
jgi:hypothetical protein